MAKAPAARKSEPPTPNRERPDELQLSREMVVKEGDAVRSGDIVAEIETDKAAMEFEVVDEGTIGKILIAEGPKA